MADLRIGLLYGFSFVINRDDEVDLKFGFSTGRHQDDSTMRRMLTLFGSQSDPVPVCQYPQRSFHFGVFLFCAPAECSAEDFGKFEQGGAV